MRPGTCRHNAEDEVNNNKECALIQKGPVPKNSTRLRYGGHRTLVELQYHCVGMQCLVLHREQ